MSEQKAEYHTGTDEAHPGFESPNYTQVPNDLFDSLMSTMDGAELKVVLAIVRQTIGYHREAVKFSISKIGTMTGLCHNSVIVGAQAAEVRGLIRRTNPEAQGSAEWEVVVSDTPSINDRVVATPPQKMRGTPSINDLQVGLNKDKERVIKDITHKPNFQSMTVREAMGIKELQRFQEATGYFPGMPVWETIYNDLHEHNWTVEQIKKPWVEWCKRGYNSKSLSWMEWINNPIPERRPAYGNKSTDTSVDMYAVQAARKAKAWEQMEQMQKESTNVT